MGKGSPASSRIPKPRQVVQAPRQTDFATGAKSISSCSFIFLIHRNYPHVGIIGRRTSRWRDCTNSIARPCRDRLTSAFCGAFHEPWPVFWLNFGFVLILGIGLGRARYARTGQGVIVLFALDQGCTFGPPQHVHSSICAVFNTEKTAQTNTMQYVVRNYA